MSKLNKILKEKLTERNHHGVAVPKLSHYAQLERIVLASMLWEDTFYVDGKSHAEKVAELTKKVTPEKVSELAIKARGAFKLRHIPLLIARELARIGKLSAATLNAVIQRPDEMGEFMAMYWKEGKQPLSNQVKKGLAQAFSKFNEYQLAKWDKSSAAIKLRDIMFLAHPKPQDALQEAMFKRIANNELKTPDTWEVALSGGADKKETFERLMQEKKLGALAFLRNLRNMLEAGVSEATIRGYSKTVNLERVLPFRFVAAARIVPQLEDMLESMMLRSLQDHEKLSGKTILLVDVSGSMFGGKVSQKGDLTNFDAAAALAMLCREVCDDVEVYTFSNTLVRVAPRRGFAMADALSSSQPHSGTHLASSLQMLRSKADRIIVFTDEQAYDRPYAPQAYGSDKGYVINVSSYENGINHGDWLTVTGFSEAVVDYIQQLEKLGTE